MTADEAAQRDANKALYRRWFEEVVSEGNLVLADELLADDYTMHFPGLDEPVDREGHKQLVMMFRAGFPDGSRRSRMSSRRATGSSFASSGRAATRASSKG